MTDRNLIRDGEQGTSVIAYAAIKYSAIVVISLAVLYFLARYVIPLFSS